MFKLRKMLLISLFAGLVYLFLAFSLVYLSEPSFEEPLQMSPEELQSTGLNFEQNYSYTTRQFSTRDGIKLSANCFEVDSDITILLVHGILATSFQLNTTSGLLREAANANVIALNLRGHGQSEGAPGNLDYVDQYVDDINDVVEIIRNRDPRQKVILAGHSMGGGIAMRYVLKAGVTDVDGYLLYAPALGWEAPTTRKEGSSDSEEFAKLHLARFIGLTLLNSVGITFLSDKDVLFFNLPEGSPLRTYSYTSLVSMSPEDAAKAFQAVDKPLLVIVGENDEMFYADRFEPLVRQNSDGLVHVIKEANHNSIHYDVRSLAVVNSWLSEKSSE
ncbi:MAG: alpha/beta hydrolase [Calditrichia bacterium]